MPADKKKADAMMQILTGWIMFIFISDDCRFG